MKSEIAKITSNRIKKTLSEQGKTQKELAMAIGIKHQSQVSQLCTGSRLPNIEKLVAIADYLDVSTDYLLGIEGKCTDNYSIVQLEKLFCDINENEIAEQIQHDSLSRWCSSWRRQASRFTAALKGE